MGGTGKLATLMGRLDEPVHLAVVDIADRVRVVVRAAEIAIGGGVERPHAVMGERVGDADRRNAVLHRDPVRARKGAEERIERPVLLHDDHDVLDLVNPGQRLVDPGQCGGLRARHDMPLSGRHNLEHAPDGDHRNDPKASNPRTSLHAHGTLGVSVLSLR